MNGPMRLLVGFACALVLVLPSLGSAQTSSLDTVSAGEIDFGGRVSSVSGDAARFQRLRDQRDGVTLNRFRYNRETEAWNLRFEMDHVGYRDQRYEASFTQYGKVQASFAWDQVPLFYSAETLTPYRAGPSGTFLLSDSLRTAVQSGSATTAVFASELRRFDLRSRRDVAQARLVYSVNPDLDLRFSLTSTARTGEQPWGAAFGFNNAIELAAPIDDRTNDVNATAEWSNRKGMVRVAYDGSWFNSAADSIVWANPLRITDRTYSRAYIGGDASSQGRMPLWPDSTAHTVSTAGSIALPARTRASGYVSIGGWFQDAELMPHTINTAIAPIELPRSTVEAEARIVSMQYRVTSRPSPTVWLSGQFRLYDYDNRTPHFAVDEYVRFDGNVATSATGGSEPFGYIRHFVDLDASFTPFPFMAFRLGYGREHDDRTYRFLDETTEHTVRTSVDSTGLSWGSVRLQYEHGVRTGQGFDEEVFSDVGEQVSLRQFDISDRNRDRVTAIVQVVPWDVLGVNGALTIGRDHRPDAAFGLTDNDMRALSLGVDAAPVDTVSAGLSYAFERYGTLQASRQASPGPQFDDPTRDWSTDMDEDVHTVTASLDLTQVGPNAALSFAYDYVHSSAEYRYVLPSGSTLGPLEQLPAVTNVMSRATADLRYTLASQLSLSLGYWFEMYDVEDFAFSPGTLDNPLTPGFLNLTYTFRPYTAHSGYARLIYEW